MSKIMDTKPIDVTASEPMYSSMNTVTSISNSSINGYVKSDIFNGVSEEWLKSNYKFVKESDLIDMVSKLIIDRLDQLLDEDTDKIVRILIENKLFQDENTGLKKQITGLEKKIEELAARVCLLECGTINTLNWNGNGYYISSAPDTSGKWSQTAITTTSTNNTVKDLNKTKGLIERLTGIFNKKDDINEQKA